MDINIVYYRTDMPILVDDGVVQVDLRICLDQLWILAAEDFYSDDEYYTIRMLIDSYMSIENATMSGFTLFRSPTYNMVHFPQLMFDLWQNRVEMEEITESIGTYIFDSDEESVEYNV